MAKRPAPFQPEATPWVECVQRVKIGAESPRLERCKHKESRVIAEKGKRRQKDHRRGSSPFFRFLFLFWANRKNRQEIFR